MSFYVSIDYLVMKILFIDGDVKIINIPFGK